MCSFAPDGDILAPAATLLLVWPVSRSRPSACCAAALLWVRTKRRCQRIRHASRAVKEASQLARAAHMGIMTSFRPGRSTNWGGSWTIRRGARAVVSQTTWV